MDTKVTTSELLTRSLERYSYADIAEKLGVNTKTGRNWSVKEDGPPIDIVKRLESYGVKEPFASKSGQGIQPWLT